jgi:hypothetical protein
MDLGMDIDKFILISISISMYFRLFPVAMLEIYLNFFYYVFQPTKEHPPHPLGGIRVRKQWSAFIYMLLISSHNIIWYICNCFCEAVFTPVQT